MDSWWNKDEQVERAWSNMNTRIEGGMKAKEKVGGTRMEHRSGNTWMAREWNVNGT
jgi:hypothetical protein